MKKIVTSLIAIVLCVATCIPVATRTVSPNAAMIDTPTEEVKFAAEVGAAVAKYAFGRAYAEVSSWAISNDVPVIGGVAKLMLSPSQRSALKQSAQVSQILSTVDAISTGITQLSDQITSISKQIKDLDQKTDRYQAGSLLDSVVLLMNPITSKYDSAWSAYNELENATSALAEANEARDNATDAADTEKLKKEADAAAAAAETKLATFIAILSEGSGTTFSADISALKTYIYNSANPTSSYIGALERYQRFTAPFEHQITATMTAAMENCGFTLYRIFVMYSEYYSYLREYTEEINKDNPDAVNPYQGYSDEYFLSLRAELEEFFVNAAVSSGVANYMLAQPISDEKMADYKKLDPNFTSPEIIDTNVSINGVSYPCYKVRANADLNYYIILKQYIDKAQIVQTSSTGYFFSDKITLYRPSLVLDHDYTDDGDYRLVSESELPAFIKDASSSVLSYLRKDGGLDALSQSTAHILLRDNTCVGESDGGFIWELKAVDASASGASGAVTLKTSDIYNGSAATAAIAIYRYADLNAPFTDNTFRVIDRSEIENRTISVKEGQTLDLTKLTVDVSNITVKVLGNCTIISNPQITLRNSRITILGGTTIKLEDVNITAKKGDLAAIVVSASNVFVEFRGTNSVSGTATGSSSATDYYANYVPGNPIGASHGMYAADNTFVFVYGSASFSGADGGAGICASGGILVQGEENSKIVANGSSSSVKKDKYFPITIGAGIGGSISTAVEYITVVRYINGAALSVKYYKLRSEKSEDYVGSNAAVRIKAFRLEVSGADIGNINASVGSAAGSLIYFPDVKDDLDDIAFYSDDIGGVNVGGTVHDVKSGIVWESSVRLNKQRVSDRISTREEDNSFTPEIYTLTFFTNGSDGTAKDGISFMLSGSEGKSDWINAGDCGKKKGLWTGSFVVENVGRISSIQVKSNRSGDIWFGGNIQITARYSGQTITFYCGHSVSDSGSWFFTSDPVYKVTIETGSEDGAGTDADIKFQLLTEGGTSWTYQLDSIHWEDDAFEKGDVATFYLDGFYDRDECLGFFLSSDCSGSKAPWKVDKVTVEKVQGNRGVGDKFTIYTNYWFRIAQTVFFGRNTKSTGAFYIEVKTSDVSDAGTNSNIYLTINGSNGSTGEIELDLMAEEGDNYERGDLDVMCLGFTTKGIGEIKSITVRKDDTGRGPDWHLEYIIIKEIVSSGQTPQAYKFTWKDWIEDETVTLTNRSSISARQSTSKFDREILSGLTLNDDGGYTLTVDSEITLSDSAFELIAEKSALLTVVMENDEKPLYEVVFDGSKFDSWHAVTLGKGYSFANGKALFDFLQSADLPTDTKIRIHAKNLGFLDGKSYRLYAKDEAGNWVALQNIVNDDGVIEFNAEAVKELMVLDKKNAWVAEPGIESYVSGETPSKPVGEALYGSFTVRYTGTAADGTEWDSSDAPTKAGKYTATFTVEATDSYDGLTYELDFEVTAPVIEPVPDEPAVPDESTDSVDSVDSTVPDESTDSSDFTGSADSTDSAESEDSADDVPPRESGTDLTWLYIVIAVAVVFGVGFGAVRFAGKKKKINRG